MKSKPNRNLDAGARNKMFAARRNKAAASETGRTNRGYVSSGKKLNC